MKKFLFTVSIFLSTFILNAQITFQKTYGGTGDDWVASGQQTTDGGYIITGITKSYGAGDWDIYLIKTNANGDTLWTKTHGGINQDRATSIKQTTDGGFIITGWTYSFGFAIDDVYLIKTDSNGNFLWSKAFGGFSSEVGMSVQQTDDGGYIIIGFTFSFGAGNYDVYLIKTDTLGNLLWSKTYGGSSDDKGTSVQQTLDGGYIICGSTFTGIGGSDIYLIKTDTNGDTLWTKAFGGVNNDWGRSARQAIDGGFIIVGYTNSFGAGGDDVYLIKTDSIGNLSWSKTYGEVNNDEGYSVFPTMDGGYIITGVVTTGNLADVYLIKTDSNGDSLWTKNIGETNYDGGFSIQQTIDGGYIITGTTDNTGNGIYDILLIKTDSLGYSGCNEGSINTIETTPATQVLSPTTTITSPATIITTASSLVGNGGVVTTRCTNVGINEITKGNSFFIFPNPSAGNFVISFEGTIMKGSVEILTLLGKKVFAENILNESKREIILKNVCSGIYFVKVFDGEKSYCRKIIVE